jgi:aryl-alcohol dehydrogenase-like predicted oxidoreductase
MRYLTLGPSGLSVSRFALGTGGAFSTIDKEQAFRLVDFFLDSGGTFIDSGNTYGAGMAESRVGLWLAAHPHKRDQIVLSSKARFPTNDFPNGLGLSRRHLSDALNASLKRLQVDSIDIYQMHAWDPLTPIDETLEFADSAIRSGKVHYLGLSNFTGWQIAQAAERGSLGGRAAPISVQVQYSLVAREAEWEILPASREYWLGVLAWSPLGGGFLSGRYSRSALPSDGVWGSSIDTGEQNLRILDATERAAHALNASLAEVALAWVHSRPDVAVVLLGATTEAELASSLRALDLDVSEFSAELEQVSRPTCHPYPYGARGAEQRSRRVKGGREYQYKPRLPDGCGGIA